MATTRGAIPPLAQADRPSANAADEQQHKALSVYQFPPLSFEPDLEVNLAVAVCVRHNGLTPPSRLRSGKLSSL